MIASAPQVLAITRDPSSEAIIATVERLPRDPDHETVVWTLWGHDYWALRYAQTFRGQLQGLTLVDHNAQPNRLVGGDRHLATLRKTFYQRPVTWWEEQLGALSLSMPSPGMVEINDMHPQAVLEPGQECFGLGNGIEIVRAEVSQLSE